MDEIQLNFSETSLQVLNYILGFIMFGVALDMSLADFKRVIKLPKAVLVGMFAQFLLLPAVTFAIILIIKPMPSIALGMILVAACPGGNISNYIVYLSKGNTALSVTMTAISTLAAIVMTPLNLSFWANQYEPTKALLQEVALSPVDMFLTIVILLGIPMLLGLFIAERYPEVANKLKKGMKIFSLVFFAIFILAALAGNFKHFLAYIGVIALIVIVHNLLALTIGYFLAALVGLKESERRAVSIEVGMQNSGLGLILIFGFFGGLGGMAIIAAWWGIWHLISGFTLSYYWRKKEIN